MQYDHIELVGYYVAEGLFWLMTTRLLYVAFFYKIWLDILRHGKDSDIIKSNHYQLFVFKMMVKSLYADLFKGGEEFRRKVFHRGIRWAIPRNMLIMSVMYYYEMYVGMAITVAGVYLQVRVFQEKLALCNKDFLPLIRSIFK